MKPLQIPFAEIIQRTQVAVGVMDSEFIYQYCNAMMADMLGLPESSIVGCHQDDIMREAHEKSVGIKIDTPDISVWLESLKKVQMDVNERQLITETIDGRYFKMHRMTLASGMHVVFGMEITELEMVKKSLEESIHALKIQTTTDELTQINNRRAFMAKAESEFKHAKRYCSKLAFIMIDIDRFKRVNDKYGHPVGDCVIQNVADLLSDTIRDCDSAGRLGGEEFSVLLPNTDLTGANVIAERLRIRIAESSITTETATDVVVTCSFGVSEFSINDPKLDSIIFRADNALYKAKKDGRNKVCLSAK